jgi:hypothetical protein
MKTMKSMVTAVRMWLGWGELSETRLSPDHGWLLREPSGAPVEKKPAPGPAPVRPPV